MNLKEIVQKFLNDNGFDGLYNPEKKCFCEYEDLMWCQESNPFCLPGFKRSPNMNEDPSLPFVISDLPQSSFNPDNN